MPGMANDALPASTDDVSENVHGPGGPAREAVKAKWMRCRPCTPAISRLPPPGLSMPMAVRPLFEGVLFVEALLVGALLP